MVPLPTEHLPTTTLDIKYHYEPHSPNTWTSGQYYGDGSGGAMTEYPQIRRCGSAVVQIDEQGNLIKAAFAPLYGRAAPLDFSSCF